MSTFRLTVDEASIRRLAPFEPVLSLSPTAQKGYLQAAFIFRFFHRFIELSLELQPAGAYITLESKRALWGTRASLVKALEETVTDGFTPDDQYLDDLVPRIGDRQRTRNLEEIVSVCVADPLDAVIGASLLDDLITNWLTDSSAALSSHIGDYEKLPPALLEINQRLIAQGNIEFQDLWQGSLTRCIEWGLR